MYDLTRVKVKLSVVVCSWVKTKEALLASHDPDELVRLGVRLNNPWIVWKKENKHLVYQEFVVQNGLKLMDYFVKLFFTLF